MRGHERVALFTDTFHEVNGVALTCRHFAAYAVRRGSPMLRVHPGAATRVFAENGQTVCELAPSRASLQFEADLRFDLRFLRYKEMLRGELERFRPDVVHVTAPGHISILGVILAQEMGIPLAASWHTNVHEFGARRLARMLDFLPRSMNRFLERRADGAILALTERYYRLARLLFAPNPELCRMLATRTGKPVYPMHRGVDLAIFRPSSEPRPEDAPFTIGFVGRLTPEKNVQLLPRLREELLARGIAARFVIIGQGSERDWLAARMPDAELPGVLRGEALARAYASLDLFAFPSATDTYGNVVQEAKACGVPVVVSNGGGPKYLVDHGIDGLIASSDSEFIAAVELLARDAHLRARMRAAAIESARSLTWDAVFDSVYAAYAAQCPLPTASALLNSAAPASFGLPPTGVR